MNTGTQTHVAIEYLKAVASGDVDRAFQAYVADDFVHHNPWFPHDRDALRQAMIDSAKSEPNKTFDVEHCLEDRDRVVTLSRLERAEGGEVHAVVHMLRFENGKIAEMWDIAQVAPEDSPNTLGMF